MCRYEGDVMLAGVLYFHRISDFRMTGVSRKNLVMFKKLCGERALHNVVIVTNMWGEVDDRIAAARETELVNDDLFFKPILDKGARIARHDNTLPSAQAIVRLLFDNVPSPLRIQEELVHEFKDLSETGAGEELSRELASVIKKYQVEIETLKVDMQQAMREDDEETRRELEIETQVVMTEIERYKNDSKRLGSGYKKEIERVDVLTQQAHRFTRGEREHATGPLQQEVERLRNLLNNATLGSEAVRTGDFYEFGGRPRGGFFPEF
jgi:hypothetical protein